MAKLLEAHYCNLSTQSNIYGLTKFVMPCGIQKILVASLQGKVVSLEFQKTKPISREVHFTYIPGDAEIVSMDAFSTFSKKHHDMGIQVGISFIKHTEGRMYHYLNIYSEWEKEAIFDLDRIAQGCQTIDLTFVPYQLYHTEIIRPDGPETVFLLSGGDNKIHLYREVEDKSLQTLAFSEEDTEELFPEFAELPSSVTYMYCEYIEGNTRRLTLLGCLDGTIRVSLVNSHTSEIVDQWSIQHDSPVTSLHLFKLLTDVSCPDFINQVIEDTEEGSYITTPEYNLLATSALDKAVVYRNVLEKGFTSPLVLPGSENYDSVMCACITDIDFDGENEILLGCYGQELLVYKFHPKRNLSCKSTPERSNDKSGSLNRSKSEHLFSTPQRYDTTNSTSAPKTDTPPLRNEGTETESPLGESTKSGRMPMVSSIPEKLDHLEPDFQPSPIHSLSTQALQGNLDTDSNTMDASSGSRGGLSNLADGEFKLEWQRTFPDPVLAMDEMDITGDGLYEIIVVSLKGVHVLQHNLPEVAKLCVERLCQAQALQHNMEDDAFQQLLNENLHVS